MDYNIKKLMADEARSNQIRHVLTTGAFSGITLPSDLVVLQYADIAGDFIEAVQIQFEHPTAGVSWSHRYDQFVTLNGLADVKEVMHSIVGKCINTEEGGRIQHLCIKGGRDIVATDKGSFLPVMVTKIAGILTTGDPVNDDQIMSLLSVLGGLGRGTA
jgi:hypothetical protein